eukprot:5679724-Pleurochrysis_carterae.AAC.1
MPRGKQPRGMRACSVVQTGSRTDVEKTRRRRDLLVSTTASSIEKALSGAQSSWSTRKGCVRPSVRFSSLGSTMRIALPPPPSSLNV